ncbi:aminotransferase class V-fold PLP-dependent enzyme [Oceanirhabdus sp. W0125-5]|uniref:aminotransferase class V-fold PLP-dependent enzyme n=1 Tax=Oceanirhabdus sp. W0125-5 TaxID=2999116 RepID=UPI0022F311DD|nr:aminotransferase class V-fold PLP-dependent enzyme [Oceanirhabdus sp. W0125-5]WBW97617.1 aminotransferase class V-fold PLP-dependent enzyme [Oceanirhabdus sp. W0125-5]
MKLYANNAATSFPKPKSVISGITNCLTSISSNPGRSASFSNLEGSRIVFECRENLCKLFNFDSPENIIFTSNITHSLNMLINGCVQKGWHVITTSMEHNSVLRPLKALSEKGIIELDIIDCDKNGYLDPLIFENHIKANTKLFVLSHSSNIIGSIQPIKKLGEICRNNSIFLIIDSAQSAGVLDINLSDIYFSALCFTGHKSLFGPQGIGGFVISNEFNDFVNPIITGGTGSTSSEIIQPSFLPDKFESGTLNTPGIAGLNEGVKFILNTNIETIREHEVNLNDKLIESLLNMPYIDFYGDINSSKRTSAVSINSHKLDNSLFSFELDHKYGIITRSGLHCAPLAHKTINTYPTGTLRLSFGFFNDIIDINYCIDSIYKLHKFE